MRVTFFKPACILFFWFSFSAFLSAEVRIEVRKIVYLDAAGFQRIPEYFSGREYEGSKIYCRSNEISRSGFYFILKVLGPSNPIPGLHWNIDWVSPDSPFPQSKIIPISNQDIFGKEVFIGLTGKDWPNPRAQPLAWCLKLMDGQKDLVAKHPSFLWSKEMSSDLP